MSRWRTRALIATAAIASIATSPKSWELTARPAPGMPTDSPAGGTLGLLVTVEASAQPVVTCRPSGEEAPSVHVSTSGSGPITFEYLCPPGAALSTVQLTGRGKIGVCSGADPKPPADQFVRVVKTELVPTWSATTEESFHVTAGVPLEIHVESPRAAYVEARSDPPGTHVRLSRFAGNSYLIELIASGDTTMMVQVKAHVYGACRPDCAKPADEPLAIVK